MQPSKHTRPLLLPTLKHQLPYAVIYLGQWVKYLSGIKANRGRYAGKILKYYRPWKKSQLNMYSDGPVQNRIPWITFEAREFIQAGLRQDMTVFEYGTGGSTLFFADRVRRVVSVENDAEWAATMRQLLENENNRNVELRLVEGDALPENVPVYPDDPACCHSGSANYNRMDFTRYVSVIDEFPDETFDIVLVDGRARAACLHRAVQKICPGGMIVLDNSDRGYYTRKMNPELKKWKEHVFYGPIPYLEYFIETTCWIRPTTGQQDAGHIKPADTA